MIEYIKTNLVDNHKNAYQNLKFKLQIIENQLIINKTI